MNEQILISKRGIKPRLSGSKAPGLSTIYFRQLFLDSQGLVCAGEIN